MENGRAPRKIVRGGDVGQLAITNQMGPPPLSPEGLVHPVRSPVPPVFAPLPSHQATLPIPSTVHTALHMFTPLSIVFGPSHW